MALAARKYGYNDSAAPQRTPRTAPRPDIRVIPGKRSENPALQSLSARAVLAFKLMLAFVAFFAFVCGVRVMLSVATVEALQTNEALEEELQSAQMTGGELEIRRSILVSPDRIKTQAAKLGMVPADEVTYLTVDVSNTVAKNADGSISIADTLENIQNSVAETAQ